MGHMGGGGGGKWLELSDMLWPVKQQQQQQQQHWHENNIHRSRLVMGGEGRGWQGHTQEGMRTQAQVNMHAG
jgi:hypothetical protein